MPAMDARGLADVTRPDGAPSETRSALLPVRLPRTPAPGSNFVPPPPTRSIPSPGLSGAAAGTGLGGQQQAVWPRGVGQLGDAHGGGTEALQRMREVAAVAVHRWRVWDTCWDRGVGYPIGEGARTDRGNMARRSSVWML